MDRPIAYDKLAREDRFVRMRAREVAQVKVEQGLPPFPGLSSRESIKERVHGIMVGELQAMEGAGRTVYDFPDAPWEFTMDMARQVWDESRHVDIYIRLLEHLDGYIGEFPETTILWRCACAEDAAARVAGVNRGLEGLACDVFNQLVHIARKMGDPDPRARGGLRARRRDHPRAHGLEVAHEADRGRSRSGGAVRSSSRRPSTSASTWAAPGRTGPTTRCPSPSPARPGELGGFTDEEIERLIKTTQRSPVY